jgi:hypothetical protein
MVFRLVPRERQKIIAPFLVTGVVVSAFLLEAMLAGHPSAKLGSYHVAYTIGLQHGVVIIGLYIVATCGSMLASGMRNVVWFGAANLIAVLVLARLCADGFASLWCFYAALASGAIALHMRFATTRGAPAPIAEVPGSREPRDARSVEP